jgi:predicted ester cyclase
MSVEANKKIVLRFIDKLWNERMLDLADKLFDEHCITHQLRIGSDAAGAARGPQLMKQHVSEWLASFPDIHFTVEQMLAEGDRVMTQCLARGTRTATWLGIPATGRVII